MHFQTKRQQMGFDILRMHALAKTPLIAQQVVVIEPGKFKFCNGHGPVEQNFMAKYAKFSSLIFCDPGGSSNSRPLHWSVFLVNE